MIDERALWNISAGVYLFTCTDADGKRPIGRTIDAVSQANAKPAIITVLAKDAPMDLIKGFGLRSSKDNDKFAGLEVRHDEQGVPWVADGALSQISCDVKAILDEGDHLLILGEVTGSQVLAQGEPMTYGYYRSLK